MPKKEVPLTQLEEFLPARTPAIVVQYLQQYKVHLTVARERRSILGDYRHRTHDMNHRISVNGNLNRFAFLITLLHELAHLLTYEQYRGRVMAHGIEWKQIYGSLLKSFLDERIFPPEIELELLRSIKNPGASSCAEDGLIRVLRKYDKKESTHCLVEEVAANSSFRTRDGRVFQKGERLRKRYKCKEVLTGRLFLFSPVYEVELVINN